MSIVADVSPEAQRVLQSVPPRVSCTGQGTGQREILVGLWKLWSLRHLDRSGSTKSHDCCEQIGADSLR